MSFLEVMVKLILKFKKMILRVGYGNVFIKTSNKKAGMHQPFKKSAFLILSFFL